MIVCRNVFSLTIMFDMLMHDSLLLSCVPHRIHVHFVFQLFRSSSSRICIAFLVLLYIYKTLIVLLHICPFVVMFTFVLKRMKHVYVPLIFDHKNIRLLQLSVHMVVAHAVHLSYIIWSSWLILNRNVAAAIRIFTQMIFRMLSFNDRLLFKPTLSLPSLFVLQMVPPRLSHDAWVL